MCFWSGQFLERSGNIGYDTILRGTVKTLANNTQDNNKEGSILNTRKNNTYNDLILMQYDTFCFHIFEELGTEDLPNGSALYAWERFNKTFQPIPRVQKTRLCKSFANITLYDIKRDPEEYTIDIEILRGAV